MPYPFTFSHSVALGRAPPAPDPAQVLHAVARLLERRGAGRVRVHDGVLTFRTGWYPREYALRGIGGGSIRAEAGQGGVVLRHGVGFHRLVTVLWSLAVLVAVAVFERVRPGELLVYAAAMLVPVTLLCMVQPLVFEAMLREVHIPAAPAAALRPGEAPARGVPG